MNFYENLPNVTEIRLEKLEEICSERLELYAVLRNASVRFPPFSKGWKRNIHREITRKNLRTYKKILLEKENEEESNENDTISHLTLSFAYSKSNELRNFFVQRELELIRWRFTNLEKTERKLLVNNHAIFKDIEEQDWLVTLTFGEDLRFCTSARSDEIYSTDHSFYTAHFNKVPGIVANRKCYLRRGKTVFSERDLVYVLLHFMEQDFHKTLQSAGKLLPQIRRTIRDLINNLCLVKELRSETAIQNIEITDSNIEKISKKHFPLCMKNILNHLISNNHLYYDMKLQYCKFLKFIGMSSDEALTHFRRYYTLKYPEEIYAKRHEYLFKHVYQLVGFHNQYSPSVCDEIINSTVGPRNNHGCPFKHFDGEKLRQTLRNEGVNFSGIDEILNLKAQGKYKVACMKFYDQFNRKDKVFPVNDPQSYFFESSNCCDTELVDIEDIFL